MDDDFDRSNWLRDEVADFATGLHTLSNWLVGIGMVVLLLMLIVLLR